MNICWDVRDLTLSCSIKKDLCAPVNSIAKVSSSRISGQHMEK